MMTDLAKLWLAGMGWYALFTLPALLVPEIYLTSIGLALALSIPAVLVFVTPTYCCLWFPAARLHSPRWLYLWVLASVAAAFELINHVGILREITAGVHFGNAWKSEGFLAFPFAAVLAGWMACRPWVKSWPYFPYEEALCSPLQATG